MYDMYAQRMEKTTTPNKQPVTIRLSAEVREAIKEITRRTSRDFSSVAHEMLEEAIKMRRIPGIYFMDTPTGRHAHIGGTGLEVWQIVRPYKEGNNEDAIRYAFHWLTEHQIRMALAYAEAYPEEIDARIRLEEEWTIEEIYARYPYMKPPWA
jgi:uncharacterized protein (DUF433 family)